MSCQELVGAELGGGKASWLWPAVCAQSLETTERGQSALLSRRLAVGAAGRGRGGVRENTLGW